MGSPPEDIPAQSRDGPAPSRTVCERRLQPRVERDGDADRTGLVHTAGEEAPGTTGSDVPGNERPSRH